MAAGLGFKTFTTGEVLTAADTNGYLMQGVLVFASAAARDAAITSPQEGQCCYLKDTDAVLTYSGAAWVGFDDSNAIQNTIVDAKGDIVAACGSDTPARLAVGTTGSVLVSDSAAATGLAYVPSFFAGKNAIINGDFNINQRSFSSTTTDSAYGFDRTLLSYSGGTCTYSAQTFTLGAAPVAGYESANFARLVSASQSTSGHFAALAQKIESVRSFAGQTVTFSFYAKASTGTPNIGVAFTQNFGSGGSPSADVITSTTIQTITSSFARYQFTLTIPSISGKTIGTTANTSFVQAWIFTSVGTTISALGYPAVGVQNVTVDTWGWQVEAGSTATSFKTATGTIQGELAACQRYYFRNTGVTATSNYMWMGIIANYYSSTRIDGYINYPVNMRRTPTSVDFSTIGYVRAWGGGVTAISNVTIQTDGTSPWGCILTFTTTGATTADPHLAYYILAANGAGYVGLSAEL